MKPLFITSALFAALALPVSSNAATIVYCGGASSCISDTDNVLLNPATNVTVGTGETNTSPPVPVQFTSFTDLLNVDASGQANISAVDGVLNSLTFTVLDGFSFERAEFNLLNALADTLSVTVSTNGSSEVFNLTSLNGANRFGITAAPGELLTSATFTSAIGFEDFRQLRLGGLTATPPPGAVPEPATWAMMLLGFGAIGFAMRRRRKEQLNVRFAM